MLKEIDMSASNWAKCPRCAEQATADLAVRAAKMAEAYGKVPVEEFDDMRARLAKATREAEEAHHTFREDYEIYGAEDGTVKVSYGGSCEKCGLSLSFDHEHALWPAT